MASWPQSGGSASAIRGVPVASTTPTTGQVLAYDGTQYAPSSASGGLTQLTGDVTAGPGTGSQAATVAKIQGVTIASTAPTTGQVLTYSGTQWAPATPAADTGITQLTGDVTTASGSGSQAATVAKVQGRTVATTAPTNGQALAWNGSAWAPASVVAAGAFSSSGLTGGANALPYFNASGAATTLAAPASKTNQVLGWDASGNLAWVAAMASVALFAGSQYVTDTYIIERYDVAIEAPNGIVTLDGTGIDTATGIV